MTIDHLIKINMRNLILLLLLCFAASLNAQKQIAPAKKTNIDKSTITIKSDHRLQIPPTEPSIFDIQYADYSNPVYLHKPGGEANLHFTKDKKNGLPVMIRLNLQIAVPIPRLNVLNILRP
jgi:hypothetical protein